MNVKRSQLIILAGVVLIFLSVLSFQLSISTLDTITTLPANNGIYGSLPYAEIMIDENWAGNGTVGAYTFTKFTYAEDAGSPVVLVCHGAVASASGLIDWYADIPNSAQRANGSHTYVFLAYGVPLGDVNGDGVITSVDLDLVKAAYPSTMGSANWNAAADVIEDGKVDMSDVAAVSGNLNKTVTETFLGDESGMFTYTGATSQPQPTPPILPISGSGVSAKAVFMWPLLVCGVGLVVVGVVSQKRTKKDAPSR